MSATDVHGRSDITEPTETIGRFLRDNQGLPTPFLVVDLDLIEARYQRLVEVLPGSRVLFAVKANPAPEVLGRLGAWTAG
jgi:ornithine decarboxylase